MKSDIPAEGNRTLTRRGKLTHDRIVESAAALMHRNGARATSLDEVLAASGAGKGQLYHYFDSKDALIQAVISHQWDAVRAVFDMENGAPGTWNDIRNWLDTVVGLYSAAQKTPGRCPLGSLANELAATDEPARAQLASIFGLWIGHLAAGLDQLQSTGRLSADVNPRQLATAALASLQGGILLSHVSGSIEPLQTAANAAYEHLHSYAVKTKPQMNRPIDDPRPAAAE